MIKFSNFRLYLKACLVYLLSFTCAIEMSGQDIYRFWEEGEWKAMPEYLIPFLNEWHNICEDEVTEDTRNNLYCNVTYGARFSNDTLTFKQKAFDYVIRVHENAIVSQSIALKNGETFEVERTH